MFDTNMCIYLMRRQPVQVAQRFARCNVGDVLMSAITFAELEYGVAVSTQPDSDRMQLARLIEKIPVATFDGAAGIAYGPIRAATRDSRKDQLDKLIAAHAIALDVVLVTNNERDFSRYPGLKVENWLATGSN
ncbi:MAG: type II toxin-antitoxin system VapC family toxin [Xanthomonadales bacterium]|nr:type II toxin-antitoxin system VapC family toxin [Xanthomonadales bacterium]MBK7144364.1 type II toxin-antitoxin system VapC family toxin [Xanthomonadales bacterium]MCC6562519.1 type II toxin-antitoxin system VapC family toxin [Xanthomonadales bacterium]